MNKKFIRNRNSRGFTMIEAMFMMGVIGIGALLVAELMYNFNNQLSRSMKSTADASMANLLSIAINNDPAAADLLLGYSSNAGTVIPLDSLADGQGWYLEIVGQIAYAPTPHSNSNNLYALFENIISNQVYAQIISSDSDYNTGHTVTTPKGSVGTTDYSNMFTVSPAPTTINPSPITPGSGTVSTTPPATTVPSDPIPAPGDSSTPGDTSTPTTTANTTLVSGSVGSSIGSFLIGSGTGVVQKYLKFVAKNSNGLNNKAYAMAPQLVTTDDDVIVISDTKMENESNKYGDCNDGVVTPAMSVANPTAANICLKNNTEVTAILKVDEIKNTQIAATGGESGTSSTSPTGTGETTGTGYIAPVESPSTSTYTGTTQNNTSGGTIAPVSVLTSGDNLGSTSVTTGGGR